MTITKKQYDDAIAAGVRAWRPSAVLMGIMRQAISLPMRIGFIRRYLGRTSGGRFGAIFRCRERGEPDKAVDLSIDALKAFRHRKPGRFDLGRAHRTWWMFMRYAAVDSLQECDDPEKWAQIITMARDGFKPLEGFDVAHAFQAFSRRQYGQRNYTEAVELATIAARADETWGEPDFLLGWYELASGDGDGIAHLSRAVRKDPKILSRIADDPICRLRPDLIARLTDISKEGLATEGDDAAPAED